MDPRIWVHLILLGECKWGTDAIDRQIVRELIEEKTPLVVPDLPDGGAGWRVHHAIFTRAGATDAARRELASHGAFLVDLERLYADLAMEQGSSTTGAIFAVARPADAG